MSAAVATPLIDDLTGYADAETERDSPLYGIARHQRLICLCILAKIASMAAVFANVMFATTPVAMKVFAVFQIAAGATLVISTIVQIVAVYKLRRALGHGVADAAVVTVLGLIHLLGLIIMLWLSHEATKRLREAGLRVGLLGVSRKAIDAKLAADRDAYAADIDYGGVPSSASVAV